jgi:hypothetical protein
MSRTDAHPSSAPLHDTLPLRILLWIGMSAAFTALVVTYSRSHGRLLCPPFYDDVAYFEDALHRLAVLERGGPVAIIPDYLQSPPHSPFSTFVALTAFRVMGVHDWAPYVANGSIIMALLLLLDHLAGRAPVVKKFVPALFVLSVPVSTAAVYEFRPDLASALACAAGVALLLWRPLATSGARGCIAAGALFGMALLFKPPTFPLTLALLVVGLFTAVVLERLLVPTTQWKTLVPACAQVILAAILIPLPHYILTWRENWRYIYEPIFGASHDVWASHLPPLGHLLYYLRGEGGQVMLGVELYPLSAIIALGMCVLLRRRQWDSAARLAGLAIATVVAYAIPTCLPMKQPFLGNCFDWLLVLMAVFVLCQFIHVRGPARGLLLVGALLCVAHRIGFIDRTDNSSSEGVMAQNRVANGLYQSLRDAMPGTYSRVYMTTTGGVSTAALDYYFRRDTGHALNIGDNPFTDDLRIHRREISISEFVIASEPGNGLAFGDLLKSGAVQTQTLDMVRSTPDFRQIAAFPALNGKSYFLFRRTRPFFGYTSARGLVESSSAYRALLPSTKLTIAPEGRAELRIVARGMSQTPDLHVQILLDGEPLQTWTPPHNHYEEFTLPFMIHGGGPHELEMRYSAPQEMNSTPILFTRLEIIPDCPQ